LAELTQSSPPDPQRPGALHVTHSHFFCESHPGRS
jgi:hypothetical protein